MTSAEEGCVSSGICSNYRNGLGLFLKVSEKEKP